MTDVPLTDGEIAYLVTALNLELRHCDPRGYPDSESYVLSGEAADLRNGLFRKLTGRDHKCYAAWRKVLGPPSVAVAELDGEVE